MNESTDSESAKLSVAISGASGLIGSAICALLETNGHSVLRLVRHKTSKPDEIYWSAADDLIDGARLEGVDAVIHLAAEPLVSLRWTDQKKRRIRDSRVDGTQLVARTIASLQEKPAVFICASAIGIYGDRGDEILTEAAPVDRKSFLADVCTAWEQACSPAREAGIRTINMRTGIVLSPNGGFLERILLPFKLGLGGRVGDKNQYASWIAIDDVARGVLHCLQTDTVDGPVNFTAPNPVTMTELTRTLGDVLHRPTVFPVPSGLLKLLTGQVADEVILASQRVLPQALLNSGYTFGYPTAKEALSHVLEA